MAKFHRHALSWEYESKKNLSKGVKHEKISLCSLFLSHSFIIKG